MHDDDRDISDSGTYPHRRRSDQVIEKLTESPTAKLFLAVVQIFATIVAALVGYVWITQREAWNKQAEDLSKDMKEIKAFVGDWRADKAVLTEKLIVLDKFKDEELRIRDQRTADMAELRARMQILENYRQRFEK